MSLQVIELNSSDIISFSADWLETKVYSVQFSLLGIYYITVFISLTALDLRVFKTLYIKIHSFQSHSIVRMKSCRVFPKKQGESAYPHIQYILCP